VTGVLGLKGALPPGLLCIYFDIAPFGLSLAFTRTRSCSARSLIILIYHVYRIYHIHHIAINAMTTNASAYKYHLPVRS
jgi:predicted permease